MPKQKTHKGTAKRVKITGSGTLKRKNAFKGHNLAKKSKSRKRAIKRGSTITGSMAKNVKRALGV